MVVTTPEGSATSPFSVALPGLGITDARVPEGNSGQRIAVFRATLSAPSPQPATVDYMTSRGYTYSCGSGRVES